jgi:phospholipase/carboxylesterase
MTRRRFGAQVGRAIAGLAGGQAWLTATATAQATAFSDGRLSVRPGAGVRATLTSGPLGLSAGGRDGVVQMPPTLAAGPVPLLLLLHGASQSGARLLSRISTAADQAGIVVVAPDSRGQTWDAIRSSFGTDVAFLNQVLEHVFARLPVDPARLAIGGFSDGASYALSLGLANGDLFPRVVAFSPGFIMGAPPHGRPRFYLSHGTADQILPIDRCSRVIVPQLRSRGYDVTLREFDGRHEVPPEIATEGLRWMLTA